MSEPKGRASEINRVFPWLLHFTIIDERLGDFRGDAYAIKSSDGLVAIDPVRLEDDLTHEVKETKYVVLSAGGHQRSTWRYRNEFGAVVYAPKGSEGLDEEPDHWYGDGDDLPAGLKTIPGDWFKKTFHLIYTHTDETKVLFCGDLITHWDDGIYRFPIRKGKQPSENAREEIRRLMNLSADALCPGHANPTPDGCQAALQSALDYEY
ncbi:MBL fold metallo-hydrolase [Candidatus Marinimicrobia bacterium MT.SAG.3]|nr:MBL fold metallo-hydrolase [Candidatus Marinimicrobia bacterium MT.SAG.3]